MQDWWVNQAQCSSNNIISQDDMIQKMLRKRSQGSTNQYCNTYLNHFVLFRAVLPTHSEEIEEFFVTLICHKYMENKNSFPP